jgi:deoxyribodipyrimidine photo-lyase
VPRIYNPVKQARDHDPHGHFVRRWLPALRQVPDSWLFEPWRMPEAMQLRHGLRPASTAAPPVDLDAATRLAKQRLFALRRPESNRPRRRSSRNMGRASGMPCVARQNPSICSN